MRGIIPGPHKPPLRNPLFLPLLLGLALASLVSPLWGMGKEDPPAEPKNPEWVLCVSAFDISSLPPEKRIVGQVLASNLVGAMGGLENRLRISKEYAYYEEAAWAASRTVAGRAIATKRAERDLLLYKGNPSWQYRRELAKIDQELLDLEEKRRLVDEEAPPVESRPQFRLTEENKRDVFPEPPELGLEYQFCAAHKADGLISGAITEYHGRLLIDIRLYTLYTRSYTYEDFAIFSPEDIRGAVDELSYSLTAILEGGSHAAIQVAVKPESAHITVNDRFAGRGKSEIIELIPGPVKVSAAEEGYTEQTQELELLPGELTEIDFTLNPLSLSNFQVLTRQGEGSKLYRGSLFVGEAPLFLSIPSDGMEFFEALGPDGERGTMALLPKNRGSLEFPNRVSIRLMDPKKENEGDIARRGFYGAYGRFWVVMPLAFVFYGVATSVLSAYNTGANPDLFDRANVYYYVSTGALAAAGGFLGESLIRMVRYLYVSSKRQTVIGK